MIQLRVTLAFCGLYAASDDGWIEDAVTEDDRRRLKVEVARITPRHRLFGRATVHLRRRPDAIWGRRTLFEYGGERILVNELFLPRIGEFRR